MSALSLLHFEPDILGGKINNLIIWREREREKHLISRERCKKKSADEQEMAGKSDRELVMGRQVEGREGRKVGKGASPQF